MSDVINNSIFSNLCRGSTEKVSSTITKNRAKYRRVCSSMKYIYVTGWVVIFYIICLNRQASAVDISVCEKFERNKTCSLPSCYCDVTKTPGNISIEDTPQMVLFTYSGHVNEATKKNLRSIFPDTVGNPNGCPIGITIFASNRSTHYCSVHQLYVRGHDIATYGLNGTNVEGVAKVDWKERFLTHKELLYKKAYLPSVHVVGARAPDYRLGGESQFDAVEDGAFEYDSSIQLKSDEPIWPFTLDMDVKSFLEDSCVQEKNCPNKSHPGLWEVPIIPLIRDVRRCYTLDECIHSNSDENRVARTIEENFKRFNKKRVPFVINIREKILKSESAIEGLKIFIANHGHDVWFLTISEMLEWIKNPSESYKMHEYEPWDCPERNYVPVCERACYKKDSDKALARTKNPFSELLPVESLWLYQTIFLVFSFLLIYRLDKTSSKK